MSINSVYENISLFWARNHLLLNLILNTAQNKPGSNAGVDSAFKNKHVTIYDTKVELLQTLYKDIST
jgi:hypothetical protein